MNNENSSPFRNSHDVTESKEKSGIGKIELHQCKPTPSQIHSSNNIPPNPASNPSSSNISSQSPKSENNGQSNENIIIVNSDRQSINNKEEKKLSNNYEETKKSHNNDIAQQDIFSEVKYEICNDNVDKNINKVNNNFSIDGADKIMQHSNGCICNCKIF